SPKNESRMTRRAWNATLCMALRLPNSFCRACFRNLRILQYQSPALPLPGYIPPDYGPSGPTTSTSSACSPNSHERPAATTSTPTSPAALRETDASTSTAFQGSSDQSSLNAADGSSDNGGDGASSTTYENGTATITQTGNESTGTYSLHETDTSTSTVYAV